MEKKAWLEKTIATCEAKQFTLITLTVEGHTRADELKSGFTGLTDNENTTAVRCEVFISHASEDKDGFVRLLAEDLRAQGLSVWYDDFTLTVGDSLRKSIDQGLAQSRFGVVVISPSFLRKEWPQRELGGLFAREVDGTKIILPVWHNITMEEIRKHSPMLADRFATSSTKGLSQVIEDLTRAISAGNTAAEPDRAIVVRSRSRKTKA